MSVVEAVALEREARDLIARAQQNMGPGYDKWHADAKAYLARNMEAEVERLRDD